MKVLLIDNYDSFTFNIVELLRQLNVGHFSIYKNDEISIEQANNFDKIIISPGPATPKESGNIIEIIQQLSPTKSILGICLGHQAIAEAMHGHLFQLTKPQHGFQCKLNIVKPSVLFQRLPTHFQVGLYHSWLVDTKNFPSELEITAINEHQQIMALQHKKYKLYGIQFHPESFMTEFGKEILKNFLED